MTTSIAVASGKGGVGKTSIAVNLALTLSLNSASSVTISNPSFTAYRQGKSIKVLIIGSDK